MEIESVEAVKESKADEASAVIVFGHHISGKVQQLAPVRRLQVCWVAFGCLAVVEEPRDGGKYQYNLDEERLENRRN